MMEEARQRREPHVAGEAREAGEAALKDTASHKEAGEKKLIISFK